MKLKNISILLFILICAGVTLLGYTQVRAQGIDLNDCECSQVERDAHLCFDLDLNGDDSIDYVVQVTANPATPGAWPGIDDSGNLIWEYRACVPEDAVCKGVPTWNYFVERMGDCVADQILYSVPPGANLVLPGDAVPKCPSFAAAAGQVILKWNPSFNCEPDTDVVFSVTTTSSVPLAFCNEAMVVTRKDCDGDFIVGPGCEEINITSFIMGDFAADLDPCTGEALAAKIEGVNAAEVLGFFCDPKEGTPLIPCNPTEDLNCTCYQLTNSGNLTGCVMKGSTRGVIGSRVYTR